MNQSAEKIAIVYSGGTDSTCVAALLGKTAKEMHLLTFYEYGTRDAPIPHKNVAKLRAHFPQLKIIHEVYSTDRFVRAISYRKYLNYLCKHRLFMLSTPGFSSLSWHLRTLIYCLENKINYVADGLTRELMQFPGHRDEVVEEFRKLYSRFGITYVNPVREWEVPRDQQFLDRLIVDRHGFVVDDQGAHTERKRTTGEYLFREGIMPSPNVKGSAYDMEMQHDCYPFVVYNIFAFWLALPFLGQEKFSLRMRALFSEKCKEFGDLVADYMAGNPKGEEIKKCLSAG